MTFPNVVARYATLRELTWRTGDRGILEVGSGAEGLAAFVSQPFVGCDLMFRSQPCAPMSPVRASACALPFSDQAFEIVVCMDALEHIAPAMRSVALRELVRVSRYRTIIGFPSGVGARLADRLLRQVYEWLHLAVPDWLDDHQRPFPGISDVKKALEPADGISLRFMWTEFLPLHFAIMLLEMHPRILGLLQRSVQWHRRTWLSVFRHLNLWPCYRLVCVVDRSAAWNKDKHAAAIREPLW